MHKDIEYRPDIDGLRAVAVLSVVVFHFFPNFFKGGFIGVDIFFVISGYLISKIIFKRLNDNSFEFIEFYERRAKRILPALLLVLTIVLFFGWFYLFEEEFQHLGKHVAAGLMFVSNLVMIDESGYFDKSAYAKPLLHLWSLGVEEQFYIFWPLVIFISYKVRINTKLLIIFLFSLSFYLNIDKTASDSIAAFYYPHTRFWELLSGSALAWVNLHKNDFFCKLNYQLLVRRQISLSSRFYFNLSLDGVVSTIGFFLLFFGFYFISKGDRFPGYYAIIPVAGTIFLIYGGVNTWVNKKILSNKLLVWIGLISFPLYLWHWPLISFLYIFKGSLPSIEIRIFCIILSIFLAWITYKYIELPLRFWGHEKKTIKIMVFFGFLILVLGVLVFFQNGFPSRLVNVYQKHQKTIKNLSEDDYIDNKKCLDYYGLRENYIRYCRLSKYENPKIALIGDSHAAALFEGLKNKIDEPILMMGGRVFVNVASFPMEGNDFDQKVYKGGQIATRFVASNKSIETVIIVSRGTVYFKPELFNKTSNFYLIDNKEIKDKLKVFEIGIRSVIDILKENNKKIIFVMEAPTLNFNPDSCFERSVIKLSNSHDCAVNKKFYQNQNSDYIRVISEITKDYPDIMLFDTSKYMCDNIKCHARNNGIVLYSDDNHLNSAGAEYLSKFIIDDFLKNR